MNPWRGIVRKHELPPFNFHGLHHTFASFILSKNVNIKVIQEQLGHKNIHKTLNAYSHSDKEQKEKASDLLMPFCKWSLLGRLLMLLVCV